MFWHQTESILAVVLMSVPGAVGSLGRLILSQSKQTFLEYCVKVYEFVPKTVILMFSFTLGSSGGPSGQNRFCTVYGRLL